MILELKTGLAVRESYDGTHLKKPLDATESLSDLKDLAQETFCILTLNTGNKLIRRHMISLGTVDSTLVHPREVFRPAITDGAKAIIVAHNHPSGDPCPSAEDIKITRQLVKAGKHIGIPVIDHLIIGDNDPLSLRESGLVNFNPDERTAA